MADDHRIRRHRRTRPGREYWPAAGPALIEGAHAARPDTPRRHLAAALVETTARLDLTAIARHLAAEETTAS